VIELLMPTAEQFAAHERLSSLPRICREIGMSRDEYDPDNKEAAMAAKKARTNRYYALRKTLRATSMTEAARTAALNAALRDAYPERFTNA
jgi:hypothetical protein